MIYNQYTLPTRITKSKPRQLNTKKGGIYMNSVYSEIEKIRQNSFFRILESSINRHCVHCQEPDGTKTAYCFSVPIRNNQNNNIIDLKYHHYNQYSIFYGTNCKIIVSDKIRIINEHGQCDIILPYNLYKKTDNAIFFKKDIGQIEIRPTLNGILLLFDNNISSDYKKIKMCFNKIFDSTRTNNKYFSIMREKFIPFVTVSCIGLMNRSSKISTPCEVISQKLNNTEHILSFNSVTSQNRIAIEINVQEPKLFQDTTVESMHPTINNAFGGISYLGTSKMFGEQWLYSRLDISTISHLQEKKIIKSILHIPQLGYNNSPITVSKISDRFCSFGSNWENKISIRDTIALSSNSLGYYHLDITKLLGNLKNKSENFVIRGTNQIKPAIIPTGDSFYTPQILEVKYQ